MNKKESNKVNSFNAALGVVFKNEPIWKGFVNVSKQVGLIEVKMPLIDVYDQRKINGKKPSSVVKKEIKVKAIPMAMKISKSAISYAAGEKDLALEFSVKLTKSDLEKLKDLSLFTKLEKFYNIVLPLKDKLEHLNATDIADFAATLERLKAALPKPQVEIGESKTATSTLETIISEINDMFIELDKFIDPFEYTHPDFYNDYKNARGVKDLKGKAKSKKNPN